MRAASVILLILAVNCEGRQVVDSPGVVDQIETIIETDVETIEDKPKRERIRTSMQVAVSEIESLRREVARLNAELEKARQAKDDARAEALQSANAAGRWSGFVWFLVVGAVAWVGWHVFRFLRPPLPI